MNTALLQSATMFAMAGAVMALSAYVTLWTGLLTFSTVSFAAVGGYVSSYLIEYTSIGLVPSLLGGVAGGAIFGLVVGRLFTRLSSHWLALATVALMLITQVFATNLGKWTGGSTGEPVLLDLSMWQMFLILVIVCAVLALLRRSKFGLAADTTREDPDVAAALGVPVVRVHIIAFAVSGAIGALGGAMEASQLAFIDPNSFYINLAVTIIASVVLGGAYFWLGPVIGAIVFTGLPVYISQWISQGQDIINGAILLIIIIWLPGGLVDPIRWRRFQERRRMRASAVAQDAGPAASATIDAGVTR
jgi:branched-chain amino acid transport system permease protein